MARRSSKTKGGKTPFLSPGRKLRICCVLCLLLGAFLGNLDRLGQFKNTLGGAVNLLPRSIRWIIPGAGAAYATSNAGTELKGKIIKVYDGDTATLLSEDGASKYKIRFYGIDAPEADQAWGKESQAKLAELIDGKEVTVKVDAVDQYQRHVGKVYCDGVYANLEMVRAGLAWHYAAYAKHDFDIAAAERAARQERLGLWKQSSPQPPWDYRREQKK